MLAYMQSALFWTEYCKNGSVKGEIAVNGAELVISVELLFMQVFFFMSFN